MILTKNICFQNIKIKLDSTTWMTLECSVVIFQALEYLWPQWPQQPQQPQWPQWPQQPHFKKEITEFYVSINHGTKITYPGLLMWNGSSKPTILLIFGTLSLGGCGDHPMRSKLILKDKGQMSWMYKYRFCDLKVNFWWPNTCLISCISIRKTLY